MTAQSVELLELLTTVCSVVVATGCVVYNQVLAHRTSDLTQRVNALADDAAAHLVDHETLRGQYVEAIGLLAFIARQAGPPIMIRDMVEQMLAAHHMDVRVHAMTPQATTPDQVTTPERFH